MGIVYNTLNVDERYSSILEPNLYYNPVLVPGVTCTDKYEIGPAGQIYVHKLTTSAVAAGTPGRDFTDEVASDTLIPIQLNNNFQKSKKIYGVQAAAVQFAAGNEYLSTAIQECREGWMQCGIACLVQEGTAATATAAITEDKVKADLIDTRTEIVKDKGRAQCGDVHPGILRAGAQGGGLRLHPLHERPHRLHRQRGPMAGVHFRGGPTAPPAASSITTIPAPRKPSP